MSYHIRKIAVAVDFGPESVNALEFTARLNESFDAEVSIIHAVSPVESKNKKAQFVGNAYEQLKGLREQFFGGDEGCGVFARVGEVDQFLYEYCVKNDIDLLVIGVRQGIKKYFSKTMAYEIIMKIECPVLSVPLGFKHAGFKNILFPVRDITSIETKLLYSLPFLTRYGANLHTISFGLPGIDQVTSLSKIINYDGVIFYPPDLENLSSKNIHAQVMSEAERKNIDLMVINATSEKEWYRIFGENYTEFILKESKVPVLSITHQFESK